MTQETLDRSELTHIINMAIPINQWNWIKVHLNHNKANGDNPRTVRDVVILALKLYIGQVENDQQEFQRTIQYLNRRPVQPEFVDDQPVFPEGYSPVTAGYDPVAPLIRPRSLERGQGSKVKGPVTDE